MEKKVIVKQQMCQIKAVCLCIIIIFQLYTGYKPIALALTAAQCFQVRSELFLLTDTIWIYSGRCNVGYGTETFLCDEHVPETESEGPFFFSFINPSASRVQSQENKS